MWCIFCRTRFCQLTLLSGVGTSDWLQFADAGLFCYLLLPLLATHSFLIITVCCCRMLDARFSCCLMLSAVRSFVLPPVCCRSYWCLSPVIPVAVCCCRLWIPISFVVICSWRRLLLSTLHSCCCLVLFVPDAVCYCRPLVLGHCCSLLSAIRSCCRLIMSDVRSCCRLMFPAVRSYSCWLFPFIPGYIWPMHTWSSIVLNCFMVVYIHGTIVSACSRVSLMITDCKIDQAVSKLSQIG